MVYTLTDDRNDVIKCTKNSGIVSRKVSGLAAKF